MPQQKLRVEERVLKARANNTNSQKHDDALEINPLAKGMKDRSGHDWNHGRNSPFLEYVFKVLRLDYDTL